MLKLEQFIGQKKIKQELQFYIINSNTNNIPLPHTILYGSAGLGKTSLVHVVANETSSNLIEKTGSELNTKIIQEILQKIYFGTILFIDEIHNMPTKSAEVLYTPMQTINNQMLQQQIDSFDFEGISISPFTVIGATTSAGMLLKPFRDRMILDFHFQLYTKEELVQILLNNKCPLNIAKMIADRSRGVPRIAVNFFIRIRNESIIEKYITEEKCLKFFDRIGINKDGFNATDRMILEYLYEYKVASESELTKTLGIDLFDYKNIYEPFLLSKRTIKISSKGRQITDKGIEYFEENFQE